MNARKQRDYYAGALMTFVGIGAAIQATRYDLGSLKSMGTGAFPLGLSILLTLLGIAIAGTAGQGAAGPEKVEAHGLTHGNRTGPDWRGWGAILASVLLFVVLAQYAGLAPATFSCVFVAAMGDRENTWKGALLLASGVTIFAIGLFHYGLHVQIPVFGRL